MIYNSLIMFFCFTSWLNSKVKIISVINECLFLSKFKVFDKKIENRNALHNWVQLSLLNLRGGGKKRKKKNYTKPKKIKHLRKKTKLKILSYYSVTENLISRLRKESPESPGCFMADHEDRITCGKTGITFIRNIS